MLITKIEPQQNHERVNVYIDGKFAFGLMEEIKYKFGLREGMEIDRDFIEEVLLEEESLKAKNVALRFLAYRKRSKKEILDKLKDKGFDQAIIENTLDYLEGYNLIDDYDYAVSFVNDRINLKKYGPHRIKFELARRGISQEIIEKVLTEDDEYPRALELAKKRLNYYRGDDRDKIYRKLSGYLQRRGYSYQCISKVLKELIE
ncbi:MAG: hypothetical protein GXY96_10860 [Tissierellia bacterium]|nr:hypothetical protein [Tissierellia bacterium]